MTEAAAPAWQDIDPGRFRRTLGQVPTAVAVVTAHTAAGPRGLVVGTFVSVSLRPPLVGMFIDRDSTSWGPIAAAGSFAVNVLAAGQRTLCARFAARGGDKFAGLSCALSPLGHPLLPGAVAWLDCRLHETRAVGDHVLATGLVGHLSEPGDHRPLVFHRGALHTVHPVDDD